VSAARAVVCDFGGVLTSPLFASFAAFQEHAGIPPAALGEAMAALTERNGAHPLAELETGRLTERAFMDGMQSELSQRLGRPVAMIDFAERYFAHLTSNTEMIDYMRALGSERGYRMAMLTNNVREWEPRWRSMLPVDEIFELVVDSAFVGMRKPDPEIYELTLERLGLPAQDCVFVDDFEVNCETAARLGMRAVRFESNDQAIPQIERALNADWTPTGP
jgi:putative hydrolase of the HAD superfamily